MCMNGRNFFLEISISVEKNWTRVISFTYSLKCRVVFVSLLPWKSGYSCNKIREQQMYLTIFACQRFGKQHKPLVASHFIEFISQWDLIGKNFWVWGHWIWFFFQNKRSKLREKASKTVGEDWAVFWLGVIQVLLLGFVAATHCYCEQQLSLFSCRLRIHLDCGLCCSCRMDESTQ